MPHWESVFCLNPCKSFSDDHALLEGLRHADTAAIQCLTWRAQKSVAALTAQAGLHTDLSSDVLNESLQIFVSKVQDGSYSFQGNALLTYFLEIVKKVVNNWARTKKGKLHDTLQEKHLLLADDAIIQSQNQREQAEILDVLLQQLGSPCREVITLRYLDDYGDEDIVEKKMTPFTTINSLKAKRSICMKKLRQLAQQYDFYGR